MTEAIRQGDIPGVQLRRRRALAAGPAAAWPWLVEPALLARWLAEEARSEAPGELLLAGTGERGEPWRERARTLTLVAPRLWVASFERLDSGWPAATRLQVQIHPAGDRVGEVEVDVLQEGFQRLPLSICLTAWESYRRRWRDALERLAAAIRE